MMKRKSNDTKLMWSIHRKDVYKYLKKAEWKRLTGGQKEREREKCHRDDTFQSRAQMSSKYVKISQDIFDKNLILTFKAVMDFVKSKFTYTRLSKLF